MADVSDRGQLILVLGVVVGTVFVVLALMLNTVIFTENLASRGTDFGDRDALEYRATVGDGVAALLAAENDRNHTTRDPLFANVTAGIDELDTILRERYVKRGAVANVSNVTIHNGSTLRQTDATRAMTDNTGSTNWTLATNIRDTRGFVLRIDSQSDLRDVNDVDKIEHQAFNVTLLGDSGDEWSLYVYDDAGTELAVKNGSESDPSADVCSPSAAPRINLTNGTVDGSPCGAIQFGKGIDRPYEIRYTWGGRSGGTYNLTVNVSGTASVETSNFNTPPSHQSPFVDPVVYSAGIDTAYETSRLRYRGRVNVTPEGSP